MSTQQLKEIIYEGHKGMLVQLHGSTFGYANITALSNAQYTYVLCSAIFPHAA